MHVYIYIALCKINTLMNIKCTDFIKVKNNVLKLIVKLKLYNINIVLWIENDFHFICTSIILSDLILCQ